MGALRSISDRLFDQLAGRKVRSRAALALAVPALVTGLAVTVHPGDTLSAIASRYCGGHAADWTGIYAANRAVIGGNPNMIEPGQHLAVRCADPGWSTPAGSGFVKSTGGSFRQTGPSLASASYTGSGGMQSCIISRESGGNSQIWNASQHYGLYQFSYQTWTAHGGAPALFGRASAAYQTQVFWATVAADGYSDWTPSDHC